jgi:hypothetical protein
VIRPLRVFVVALLAGSMLVGLGGTALADSYRPASFCGTAKNVADEFRDLDPSDFTDEETFETAEKIYKRLAKEAPKSLRASFKRITKYYGSLADAGEVTDPEDIQAFVEESTKAGRALNKVVKYLTDKCKIDLG